MADLCSSHNCNKPIRAGQKMVQVARGYWREGYITPTLERIESEWHERCYRRMLIAQSLPYTCSTCNQMIEHNQYVAYVTIGDAPDIFYIRAERRGYQLAFIEHVKCPASRAA
jgi:hypothetical protein